MTQPDSNTMEPGRREVRGRRAAPNGGADIRDHPVLYSITQRVGSSCSYSI